MSASNYESLSSDLNKVVPTADQAVADIAEGHSVAIVGFGVNHRFPSMLIGALWRQGTKNLCVICNSPGGRGAGTAQDLITNHQVSKLVTCFSARPGPPSPTQLAIAAGEIKLELVPQGTLVERMRAGGAGIPAFYTKSGVGTAIAEGKETRVFGDQEYVMEQAMKVDFAFLHAWRGDKAGNLQFRGGSQCFNVSFAKAARVAIAEVEEIVEVGDIPPENVDLPGIFVSRIVELPPEEAAAEVESGIPRRSRDSAREYNGKPALTRQQMAQVAASLLPSTGYVNLGIGLPTLVADYLDANDIVLHAENGILGYGEQVSGADVDQDLYNAGGEFISLRPGASFFESVTSFEMARSGRLAAVLLGAYQVDERGNLANYATPGMIGGGIGGAMDLVVGGSPVIILTEHRGSKGDAKLVRGCTYPLTGKECVNVIVTDLALLRRGADGFVLEAVAPGFTPEEVVGLTEMRVAVPESVGSMAAALEAVG